MKCYGQAAHTHTGVGHEISACDKGTMTLTIHGRWPWANLCVLFLQIRIWKRIVGGKGNSKLFSISAHAEMAAVYEAKTDECEEGEALLQSDQCATTQSRRGTTASFPNHTFWRVLLGQACSATAVREALLWSREWVTTTHSPPWSAPTYWAAPKIILRNNSNTQNAKRGFKVFINSCAILNLRCI